MEKEGLMYGQELSDETLAALMSEVMEEVKRKAKEANEKFNNNLSNLINDRILEIRNLINNGK
jgi:polyhydroxyalkanoate synthesis regulator phasin